MDKQMFCNQCQETFNNQGCTVAGVCGKSAKTANLQDILIETTINLAKICHQKRKENQSVDRKINQLICHNLFITITNANFDDAMIIEAIKETNKLLGVSNELDLDTRIERFEGDDEDVKSVKELILYGLKGMAAYNKHANNLNYFDDEVDAFLQETLASLSSKLTLEQLIPLTLKTGEYGVKVMALLDQANNDTYGHPEITKVNIGVNNNPGILVSGHDLKDLQMLLEQTKGTGVDVYTHSEMLPANYYPFFKQYDHFVGNYGNAWWKQKEEFESFKGPILLTTNCLVPPKASYKNRIYTTGAVGFEGCQHILADENGNKDFTVLIEHAKKCQPPQEIEKGEIVGGFAHHQVMALANDIIAAINNGAIKKFVVMAGCDGRMKSRQYYEDFAKELPNDAVILTAGCAKYRYNKLNLGDINGIPRVLDAGQCNDSYSLALIAIKLKEALGLNDINELPIIYNIAWYEQKAVIVLLALLSLGVKNIHLGPTLPAFLSNNVIKFLVDQFNISGIEDVVSDMKKFYYES